jgi:hypothetical protein
MSSKSKPSSYSSSYAVRATQVKLRATPIRPWYWEHFDQSYAEQLYPYSSLYYPGHFTGIHLRLEPALVFCEQAGRISKTTSVFLAVRVWNARFNPPHLANTPSSLAPRFQAEGESTSIQNTLPTCASPGPYQVHTTLPFHHPILPVLIPIPIPPITVPSHRTHARRELNLQHINSSFLLS